MWVWGGRGTTDAVYVTLMRSSDVYTSVTSVVNLSICLTVAILRRPGGGECDPAGSLDTSPDPRTGRCACKVSPSVCPSVRPCVVRHPPPPPAADRTPPASRGADVPAVTVHTHCSLKPQQLAPHHALASPRSRALPPASAHTTTVSPVLATSSDRLAVLYIYR